MKGQENAAKKIEQAFRPQENDAIIIAGADREQNAEEDTRAAAWTLIE